MITWVRKSTDAAVKVFHPCSTVYANMYFMVLSGDSNVREMNSADILNKCGLGSHIQALEGVYETFIQFCMLPSVCCTSFKLLYE